VVGVETLFHARPPRPNTQPAAPALWFQRLVLPFVLKEEGGHELEIYALGTFRVVHRGKEVRPQDFGRRKAWTLLKLLLSRRDRPFHVEDIAEALFPGAEPEKARQEVYALVYHLRKTLPGLVEREGEYYRLVLPASSFLDVDRFEALLDQAEREEGLSAFRTLREALALYKGPFLGDDPYGEWAEVERVYLENRALAGLLRLGSLARALGYTQAALEAYLKALRLDPGHPEALAALEELQPGLGASLANSNDYDF
jgi:DNA-binding SARP family transcriptional activator